MRLRIIVDIDDNIDPGLNDPEEIADALVDIYENHRHYHQRYPPIELVTAEWS